VSDDQTAAYRPKAVTQRDGSRLENSNCRMASAATGLDYHTRGDQTSTGAKMRDAQGDQVGGTDANDAKQAWKDGYGQTLVIRNGNTFDTLLNDLKAGRLVHIDVWHAAAGGPCLSGSGGYGHTMVVLPDCKDGLWLVCDPWCRPAKWVRWSEAKLKAGAETLGREVYGQARKEPDYPATGGPKDPAVLRIVARVLKRLMTEAYPTHEGELTETGGGTQPVLYTVTKARQPGGEMATIILNSGVIETKGIIPIAGRGIYDQPGGAEAGGKVIRNTVAGETLLHLGYVDGGIGWEVIDLGNKVAYLKTDAIHQRVDIPLPGGDCSDEDILAAQQEGYDLALSVFPPRPE
jgi:hypothetical protein